MNAQLGLRIVIMMPFVQIHKVPLLVFAKLGTVEMEELALVRFITPGSLIY